MSYFDATRARRVRLFGLCFLVLLAARSSSATVLYDGTTIPGPPDWIRLVPPFATDSLGPDGVTLDTTFANALQAGYARLDQTLDSEAGFRLSFSLSLLSESHGSGNRAGFSVIVLDSVGLGLELGFWGDEIWAQNVGFTHAEGASWATSALTDYDLVFSGATYALLADGAPLLKGALRDYSAFGAPYNLSNFLFFGDDTSSARAKVTLASVSLTAVPEPATGALLLAAFGLVTLDLRRRRA
jgi:PEP-CTERM motif